MSASKIGSQCWWNETPHLDSKEWATGTLLWWGIDYEMTDYGIGQFTVAVVSGSDDRCHLIPVSRIKFEDQIALERQMAQRKKHPGLSNLA